MPTETSQAAKDELAWLKRALRNFKFDEAMLNRHINHSLITHHLKQRLIQRRLKILTDIAEALVEHYPSPTSLLAIAANIADTQKLLEDQESQ